MREYLGEKPQGRSVRVMSGSDKEAENGRKEHHDDRGSQRCHIVVAMTGVLIGRGHGDTRCLRR